MPIIELTAHDVATICAEHLRDKGYAVIDATAHTEANVELVGNIYKPTSKFIGLQMVVDHPVQWDKVCEREEPK